ncbi:hypothetical protein PVK06_006036 [Gossypium arboreum]|uniref:Pentatricopeptide repeat-containing protein n=1 Tax=Gossypium arboreum TaxID=29729 RepID=A0ABR0QW81_GOSAR|nr:hypothetical protein PVK06_006036 [Gossypium arboreum]
MKNHGHKPDTVSYRVLAGSLARNAAALVDGYSEAGQTEKAFNLVLKLHKQGFLVRKISCSLCKRGYVKKAVTLFNEMPKRGIQPDEIT